MLGIEFTLRRFFEKKNITNNAVKVKLIVFFFMNLYPITKLNYLKVKPTTASIMKYPALNQYDRNNLNIERSPCASEPQKSNLAKILFAQLK